MKSSRPIIIIIVRNTAAFFRPVVDGVGEEYLKCGDLHDGLASVRCPILNAAMDLLES